MTTREKLRRDTSDAQGHPIALVAEIAPRDSQGALVRKHIDEAEIDNIQRGFVTEMAQSGLVLPLSLGQSVKATRKEKHDRDIHNKQQHWFLLADQMQKHTEPEQKLHQQ